MKESTHSLWAWLNQPGEKKKYLNPLYSHNALVIWPSVEPQSIQLWQGKLGPAPSNPVFSSELGWVRESRSCFSLSRQGYGPAEVTHSPCSPRFILPLDPFIPVPG